MILVMSNVSVRSLLNRGGRNKQTAVFGICSFLFVYVFAGRLRALRRAGLLNQTAWTVKFGGGWKEERREKTPVLERQALPSLNCGSLASSASVLAASFEKDGS